jgi:hypothetical protein
MSIQPKRVNYLNNKDLLKEIHKSKLTFCYVEDDRYSMYDIIVNDVSEINPTTMAQAKANRASRIQTELYNEAMATHNSKDYRNKPKQKDFAVDVSTIADDDVVFRVMTYEHIPEEFGRKKNPRNEAEEKSKVNFPPFKHYAYTNNDLREVVRSHWQGSISNGHFCVDHGRITNKLGKMFLTLTARYSHRSNWRGYTYVDEMRGQALVQLSQVGLQFNEAKSDNPFAYYTAAVNNSFTRVLNLEKKNQKVRDDILIEHGHKPSYSRQLAHEAELKALREQAEAERSSIEEFNDL